MKITRILLPILFVSIFFGALELHAQQAREMYPLEIDDYECLKSLECIQSSQSLKRKGWSFIFDETVDEYARELTARMKGKNVSFLAKYDKEGFMIGSKYKLNNIALPTCLLTYLVEGKYKGWQITASEMVMDDFDPASVRYKVLLKNDTSLRSEVFDSEFIGDLHLKFDGHAKHCLM